MKSIRGFLRRSIISDPHLWIAFVAAAIFLLMDFLHALKWLQWEVPAEGLLIVITFCIITLLGDRLWEGEQVRENVEKLGRIANSIFDKRVALRSRPTTGEEYADLWGGYTGKYYAYNPSYRVDKNTGEKEIVNILLHRYRNPHFDEARYLFLTKDLSGQEDLKIFRKLMAQVKQAYTDVDKKIKVREMKDKEASSAVEMYLGTRDGMPMGVLELKDPTLELKHGMPHYYLIIQDKDVVKYYISEHFELAWNDEENAKDVEHFWEV